VIVVTGAAGFIGSHLVERLLETGAHVVGIDNLLDNYPRSIKLGNIQLARSHPNFRFVEGDVRDSALMASILSKERVEAIVHLAAIAGVRRSVSDPVVYVDVNVGGTANLLSLAVAHNVERFVLASSSSVYGNSSRIPFSEADPCVQPVSPYAASKRAAELLCYTYHNLTGLKVVILRLFTVYGPRQRPEMAIHRFIRLITAGEPVPMYGDGHMKRDYTYVGDIVDGIVATLSSRLGLETLNLGGSSPVSLCDLIEAVSVACGRKSQISRLPVQPGDVEITYADISRAGALLGYRPKVDLAEGLTRSVEWFRRLESKDH